MRSKPRWQAVLCVTGLAMACQASQADSPPYPPDFNQPSYTAYWDVSGPGLHSFELTGSASHEDLSQTVHIGFAFPRPWSRFSSVDGNPATFSLRAVDLDSRWNGGVFVFGLGAYTYENPSFSNTARITVYMVPEPNASATLAGLIAFARRKR